jgi:hypothetical protein
MGLKREGDTVLVADAESTSSDGVAGANPVARTVQNRAGKFEKHLHAYTGLLGLISPLETLPVGDPARGG